MKELLFRYKMDVSFSDFVGGHSFTIKCIPKTSCRQEIQVRKTEIQPISWISFGKDSFENEYIYGKSEKLHDNFSVVIEGEATVHREGMIEKEEKTFAYADYPTSLTGCSDEMALLADRYRQQLKTDPIHFTDYIYALMEEIYQCMLYVPASTTIHTTAAEAFAQKQGVCQDYAHIMLAICRSLQIPCLYVAGYMVGEGASHAWVRVLDSHTGRSYEIDPTNHRWVNDEYIDVSIGKDAQDCKMNKGIYKGFATEQQEVTVIVKERNENG
ncbi:MAG: transglutaminase family protein [Eubacteriales bacterium]|nr:transglutaminase family protein [Eubacteriales bacterium]